MSQSKEMVVLFINGERPHLSFDWFVLHGLLTICSLFKMKQIFLDYKTFFEDNNDLLMQVILIKV